MADDLVFYTNPMSRGRIVRWMLEEVGAPYEARLLDYAGTMKADDYRAVNPMGKVPAIVHNGQVVTECAAICAYLADAFPDAGLAPPLSERADYFRWLFFAAGPVEQAVTNRALGFAIEGDQERMAGYGNYDLTVDVLERAVSRFDYITGDKFTAVDVYLGSQIAWGVQFKTLPMREAFTAYLDRILTRDAYRRAAEIDDALMLKEEASAG